MLKILLVGHARIAEGMKSSIEKIMGEQDRVYTISAFVDDIPYEEKLSSVLKEIDVENNKLIIVSDIFGGSVNQKTLANIDINKVTLVSGMNLGLLLELTVLEEDDATDEKIRGIIQTTNNMIMLVNDEIQKEAKDDFDF